MVKIPVEFDFDGKHFAGILQRVNGAASAVGHYHLYINSNRYAGQLVYSEHQKAWQFSTQKDNYPELAKLFGEAVERFTPSD